MSHSKFEAEDLAIVRAAKTMHTKKLNPSMIFVDSQAAIRALDSEIVRSKAVFSPRKTLNRICNTNDVTLSWVPGHTYICTNIEGNEIADELAKEGSAFNAEPTHTSIGAPIGVLKRKTDIKARDLR